MQTQAHPLQPFFQHEVNSIFAGRLGIDDPEVANYIAHILCRFSEEDSLFLKRGTHGLTVDDLIAMIKASDPVFGDAASFDTERAMRKYIGDYSLFVAGMVPEALDSEQCSGPRRPSLEELIRVGRQSYYVVSQFNVFEYKREAPLFTRLSAQFDRLVLGLALVREQLGNRLALPTPQVG